MLKSDLRSYSYAVLDHDWEGTQDERLRVWVNPTYSDMYNGFNPDIDLYDDLESGLAPGIERTELGTEVALTIQTSSAPGASAPIADPTGSAGCAAAFPFWRYRQGNCEAASRRGREGRGERRRSRRLGCSRHRTKGGCLDYKTQIESLKNLSIYNKTIEKITPQEFYKKFVPYNVNNKILLISIKVYNHHQEISKLKSFK